MKKLRVVPFRMILLLSGSSRSLTTTLTNSDIVICNLIYIGDILLKDPQK